MYEFPYVFPSNLRIRTLRQEKFVKILKLSGGIV